MGEILGEPGHGPGPYRPPGVRNTDIRAAHRLNWSVSILRAGARRGYRPVMIRFDKGAALVLTAAAALAGLTGCGPASTGNSASSSTTASSSAPPTDAAGLSAVLKASASKIHSAHLSMNIAAGTATLTGSGDETMAAGKLQSLDLTEHIPQAGSHADRHGRRQDLPAAAPGDEPVGEAVGPGLADQQQPRHPAAGDDPGHRQADGIPGPVHDVQQRGTVTGHEQETLDGAPTTHYTLTVDVQKLPATLPGKQQLIAAGLTSLPMDMWVTSRAGW